MPVSESPLHFVGNVFLCVPASSCSFSPPTMLLHFDSLIPIVSVVIEEQLSPW